MVKETLDSLASCSTVTASFISVDSATSPDLLKAARHRTRGFQGTHRNRYLDDSLFGLQLVDPVDVSLL